MKYIRTKDSVYEVVATPQTNKMYENSNCYQVYDSKSCIRKDIYIDEILKQTDTIEELCDEFVIDSNINNTHYTESWYDLCEELQEDRIYPTDVVYGAIWTEWGLKYVAKMNEEGVLELL